jgi:hypothetical protein
VRDIGFSPKKARLALGSRAELLDCRSFQTVEVPRTQRHLAGQKEMLKGKGCTQKKGTKPERATGRRKAG